MRSLSHHSHALHMESIFVRQKGGVVIKLHVRKRAKDERGTVCRDHTRKFSRSVLELGLGRINGRTKSESGGGI